MKNPECKACRFLSRIEGENIFYHDRNDGTVDILTRRSDEPGDYSSVNVPVDTSKGRRAVRQLTRQYNLRIGFELFAAEYTPEVTHAS